MGFGRRKPSGDRMMTNVVAAGEGYVGQVDRFEVPLPE